MTTDISREAVNNALDRLHESKAGVHVRTEMRMIVLALRAALDAAEARKPTVAEAARVQYIGFDFGGPGGDESCIVIRNPTPETLAALRAIAGGDAND